MYNISGRELNGSNFSYEQKSLELLDSMFVLNTVIYLVISPITIFSNFVVFLILSNRKKRFSSHHYSLIRHMTAVASLQALYVMANCGIVRTVQTVYRIPDTGTVLKCGLRFLPLEILIVIDRYNVLLLAIDRLIAVILPLSYKNVTHTNWYVSGTILLPYVAAVVDVGSKYALYTDGFMFQRIVLCHMPYTRTEEWLNYAYYEGLVVDISIILIYLSAIIYVQYKIRVNVSSSKQLKKELGFRLMLTCAIDALVYTCTYFLSNIFGIVFVKPASPYERIKLGVYVMNFILISTIPRFMIVCCLNSDFRKEFLNRVYRKSNTVTDGDFHMSDAVKRYNVKE